MEKYILDIRRKQSTPCQAQLKNKQNKGTCKLRSRKENWGQGYDPPPFPKCQHPGIHLCDFSFSSPKSFSSEIANSCNGSKKGTLRAVNLLRKTTKQSYFLCCPPQRYASHSLGSWKNLALSLFCEGKLEDLEAHLENYIFLIPDSGGRQNHTAQSHWWLALWRALDDSPLKDFQSSKWLTSCVGMLQPILFILLWAIKTGSVSDLVKRKTSWVVPGPSLNHEK